MMPDSMLDQYKEMSDANQFLAAHCEKTLKKQAKLLYGVSHSVNRCNAEYASLFEGVKSQDACIDALKGKLAEALAAIGKLQEQVGMLDVSLGKAREAYTQLVKKMPTSSSSDEPASHP